MNKLIPTGHIEISSEALASELSRFVGHTVSTKTETLGELTAVYAEDNFEVYGLIDDQFDVLLNGCKLNFNNNTLQVS